MFRRDPLCQCIARLYSRQHGQPLAILIRCLAAIFVVSVTIFPGADLLAENKSRSPVTSSIKTLNVSPQELRIRVRALIRPTLGVIEEYADLSIANTSDPVIRRGLLVLKIEMSATMLAAMLRSDPVLAIADSWAYAFQVKNLLKRPDIRVKYGISAPTQTEAFAIIDGQFRELVSSVHPGPGAEKFEANLRKWADRNPIEGAIYRRPSIDSEVAKMLAAAGDGGVFSALGSLEETTADVIARMDLYTMYLPRLARWEAELTADDLTGKVGAQMLSADFVRLTRATERIATLTETVSDLAVRERTAILDAVQNERIAALREFEEVRKRFIVDATKSLEQAVDHAFLRLVQLLVICMVLVTLGLALRGYIHRKNAPKSPD